MSVRKANDHRRKARWYLEEARETTDLNRRQELLNLCEQELAAAATTMHKLSVSQSLIDGKRCGLNDVCNSRPCLSLVDGTACAASSSPAVRRRAKPTAKLDPFDGVFQRSAGVFELVPFQAIAQLSRLHHRRIARWRARRAWHSCSRFRLAGHAANIGGIWIFGSPAWLQCRPKVPHNRVPTTTGGIFFALAGFGIYGSTWGGG